MASKTSNGSKGNGSKASEPAYLSKVRAAYGKAGSKATPPGTVSNGGQPFTVGKGRNARTFSGMADLADRAPDLFATLTVGELIAGGASKGRAGALMAHRTRILHAALAN
jgi:hypothetical protein